MSPMTHRFIALAAVVVAFCAIPTSPALSALSWIPRLSSDIENFLSRGCPLLIARIAEAPVVITEEGAVPSQVVRMETIQVFSGPMPDSFDLRSTWRIADAKPGTRYLLCLRPRSKGDEPFEAVRDRIYTLDWLEKNDPLLLSAIAAIVKTEAMPDKSQRSTAQRTLLESQNQVLQMYAFRSLCSSLSPYHPSNPLDPEQVDELQSVLATFLSDTRVPVPVRAYAFRRAFFFTIPERDAHGERIFPQKLIAACLGIAGTDPDASIREAAVEAVWGMSQTGLGGIPKRSYEAALPALVMLFSKEADSNVSKMIAMAITVIGSRKHEALLEALTGLSQEKMFYITKIQEHWNREGDVAENIRGTEFDFPRSETAQPEHPVDGK